MTLQKNDEEMYNLAYSLILDYISEEDAFKLPERKLSMYVREEVPDHIREIIESKGYHLYDNIDKEKIEQLRFNKRSARIVINSFYGTGIY